ncbi:hypothetical protein ABK040_001063 [Willaertia magna]
MLENQKANEVKENIKEAKGFVFQEQGNFIFASYKIVSSDSFPSIGFNEIEVDKKKVLSFELEKEELTKRMIRREIRGLVFDKETKRLIIRSMPKFFNLDERKESSLTVVEKLLTQTKLQFPNEKPFILLEKLDGSLCTPCIEFIKETKLTNSTIEKQEESFISFRFRFRTKLGYQNEHAQSIEEFIYNLPSLPLDEKEREENSTLFHEKRISSHESRLPIFHCKNYLQNESIPLFIEFTNENSLENQLLSLLLTNGHSNCCLSENTKQLILFCVHWMNKGYSPLFEYFSPEHRVVINYGNIPFLSCLALRHTINGDFLPYEELKKTSEHFKINYVKECSNEKILKAKTIKEIKKEIEMEKGNEGYVMVLKSGFMFKIKSDWYLNIHKTNEMLQTEAMREGRVWILILENKLDDVLPHIHSEEHLKRLEAFNNVVVDRLMKVVSYIENLMDKIDKYCKENVKEMTMEQYFKIIKELCKDEHMFFTNAILKYNSVCSKKNNKEILEENEMNRHSILLDIVMTALKPLVNKKLESAKQILQIVTPNEKEISLF